MKAKTMCPTDVVQLTKGELHINIYPRLWDSWKGTSSQLIEAGLIPEGFVWPARSNCFRGVLNGIETSIQRKKEPGSDRKAKWTECDYWKLTRFCPQRSDHRIYEKHEALREEIWRRSRDGQMQFDQYWRASKDKAFQRVKAAMLYPGSALAGFGANRDEH
jgi:hypothetical protein